MCYYWLVGGKGHATDRSSTVHEDEDGDVETPMKKM